MADDRHGDSRVGAEFLVPHPELFAGLLGDPAVELDDGAHFLRDHDELAGLEKSTLRVLPTHQGLETGDVAVGNGDDGLKKNPKLAAGQGAPQVVLEP